MFEQCLEIAEVCVLSPRHRILRFESPEIAGACRPGQFVMLSVSECVDPLLRRPMAVYRLQRDGDGRPRGFALLIEVLGRGTRLLAQRRVGERLRVLGPLGMPFRYDERSQGDEEDVLVMGGVGAAPFPLLAEELVGRGHRVRAFVGARSAADLLCVGDLEELSVPVAVATEDGSAGHHGLVTGPLGAYLAASSGRRLRLYACGPKAMMRAVDRLARTHDLPLQVSMEAPMACGVGVCLSCVVKARRGDGWTYVRCCREGPVFDSRELIWE